MACSSPALFSLMLSIADMHANIERKRDEENHKEAQKREEARMAAEARELLSKGDKKPEGATDQSKKA